MGAKGEERLQQVLCCRAGEEAEELDLKEQKER